MLFTYICFNKYKYFFLFCCFRHTDDIHGKLHFYCFEEINTGLINIFWVQILGRSTLIQKVLCAYGSYCVGRKVTQSMSYFLYLCDCSVPYCAFLEAWNWVVAGQHLNASHPRSSVWPNPNVTIFSGNYFWKTSNCHITSTIRVFDLIPKLRARSEYQL